MSSKTVSDLKVEAASIGLTGDGVAQYILDHQKEDREVRAHQRELARLDVETAERDRVRAHELEMARLRASNPNPLPTEVFASADKPKLPMYKPGDDIGSFIVRFERIASMLTVPQDSYAVRLGTVLSGKAMEVYASLSEEVTADYSRLKSALLTAFNKTPDGYRFEFKTAKVGQNETFEQFASSVSRKLNFWLDSLGVEKTYDGLRQHMVYDQILSSVSHDLRLYLKERNPKTLKELTVLADNWSSARKTYRNSDFPRPKVKETSEEASSSTPEKKVEPNKPDISKIKCHNCQQRGHYKSTCPSAPQPSNIKEGKVNICSNLKDDVFTVSGSVNGTRVSDIKYDTGCDCIIISNSLVPDLDTENCERTTLKDYLGRADSFPVVKVYIECILFSGWTTAVVAPLKHASVLLGHVKEISERVREIILNEPSLRSVNVVTRSHTPSPNKNIEPLKCTPEEFLSLQEKCDSLKTLHEKAKTGKEDRLKDGSVIKFIYENGFLYRKSSKSPNNCLVIPKTLRNIVLEIAHESPLAGHFSHRKTQSKIFSQFFWPNASSDIRRFCRSCEKCQRFSAKRTVPPVPLEKMPIITEPFSRINMDIVGPITPSSSSGYKYILTVVDNATGFPEALPLRNIEAQTVAESLLEIFTRVGIPREVQSDNGKQFKCLLMQRLHSLLGVKPIFSSVYHPQTNGRVERMHSTMKTCLRKLCSEKPRTWDRYLSSVMFAIREAPCDSTGFSPFELLYGRQARGPLSVLRNLWENEEEIDERDTHEYVIELQKKLKECAELAGINRAASATKYKSYHDIKAQNRKFEPGHEVLVLLPDSKKKLLTSWSGPFKVVKKIGKVNYILDVDGSEKLFHANLLKRFFRRDSNENNSVFEVMLEKNLFNTVNNVLLEEPGTEESIEEKHNEIVYPYEDTEDQPSINEDLEEGQKRDINLILENYDDVFSNTPGFTNTVVHEIKLTTTEPIRAKLYPVPLHLQKNFNEEVEKLLELNIIQPSTSPYCSPVVLVKKSDQTYRMTVDYRRINSVTQFDAEPTCTIEENLNFIHDSKFLTELDLTRAYYQVGMGANSQSFTAFSTNKGLMEFTRMPFGLVNACATYIRLMRKVFENLENVTFYFDNILIYSKSWDEHLETIKKVLDRLRDHGLKLKPSKCKMGYSTLDYLGFKIGNSELRPQVDKINAILNLSEPKKKKDLRSFLGLVSFYRKFVPNLASLTAPLSDLLKKEVREPFDFSEENRENFRQILKILSDPPVLKLPDPSKDFIIRSDASSKGLGAVLLQYHDGIPFPVSYASRKLLPAEMNYSTVERECLGVLFAITKFNYYLIGKKFSLEVDHKPLVYLNLNNQSFRN